MKQNSHDPRVLAGVIARGPHDPAAALMALAAMKGVDLNDRTVLAEQVADVDRGHHQRNGPLPKLIGVKVATDADDDTLARRQQVAREECTCAFTITRARTAAHRRRASSVRIAGR